MYAMYLYGTFLSLCLPVTLSSSTADSDVKDHSGAEQLSATNDTSSRNPLPVVISSSNTTDTDIEDHSNSKESSATKYTLPTNLSLPRIPQPGQSFRDVKTSKKNYVVVDKTNFLKELIDNEDIDTNYKIYFLSRPRTFGKSFFLSMVQEFLDGKKGLFENTAIVSRGNTIDGNGKWKQNPVIFLDFSSFVLDTAQHFREDFEERLREVAEEYSISANNQRGVIRWLIRELKSKFNSKVSILVDEFDFPLTMPNVARKDIRLVLEMFYAEIRAAAFASELWLVLIVGVSKLRILEDVMNGMVTDITFHDKFSSIMGFSADEIEKNFKPHLHELAKSQKWDIADTVPKINEHYGGYRFSAKNRDAVLSDTCSVGFCLREFEMSDFVTNTRALSGIVRRMKIEGKSLDHFKYYCIPVSELRTKYHNVRNREEIPLYMIMLCHGYLTIVNYHPKLEEVCLSYPNKVIEKRIERGLPVNLRRNETDKSYRKALTALFQDALDECDMKDFVDMLNRHSFPVVNPSLKYKVEPGSEEPHATNHILQTLKILELDCAGSTVLKSTACGGLDLVIFAQKKDMPHYAIKVKFATHPFEPLIQLFKYVVTTNVEFERDIFDGKPKTDIINLLGFVVRRKKDDRQKVIISDWILVPYKHKKIKINEAKASNPGILLSLSRRLKEQTYLGSNKGYFVFQPVTH